MAEQSEKARKDLIHSPVTDMELGEANAAGTMDSKSEALLKLELEQMGERLEKTGHKSGSGGQPGSLMGLALSGGGIRSATFNLGVLQVLAREGWLKRVDYLSTVSGGGYIGSALTWWASGRAGTGEGAPFGDSADDFPYGTGGVNKRLKHLREHGNFLTPGSGLGLFSGLAVVLRGTLVNLLIWIPLLAFVMYLMYKRWLVLAWINIDSLTGWLDLSFLAGLPVLQPQRHPNGYELLFWLALLVAALYLLACLVYSLTTGMLHWPWLRRIASWLFLPSRYNFRRLFEIWAGRAIRLVVVALVFSLFPVVVSYLHNQLVAVGPGAMLAGLASTGWAFLRTRGNGKSIVPFGLVVSLAALLMVFGILLIAQILAYTTHCALLADLRGPGGTYCANWKAVNWDSGILWFFLTSVWLAFALGIIVNLNYMTLHRFYRDRLMEAFLPSLETANENATKPSPEADRSSLSSMWGKVGDNAPYQLINANLVLVNSDNQKYRKRGGDSFLLSPLYCGSNATGWEASNEFMRDRLSLASAMAISGAAANPNTGAGGRGVTRNRFVSLLMALVNIQLGYWVPHPKSRFFIAPTHFLPGLYIITGWVLGLGFTEKNWFYQLSDGGHFDNLGIYELIRRRMKLIVVCDAGADPDFAFEDLQIAVTRVREDFGTKLKFWPDSAPPFGNEHAVSRLIAKKEPAFPRQEDFARAGYVIADICYPGGGENDKGLLLILKTTLVPDLPIEVLAYKAAHPDFPDETTADQFFDDAQFEAYRRLGMALAEAMMNDKQVKDAVMKIYGVSHLP